MRIVHLLPRLLLLGGGLLASACGTAGASESSIIAAAQGQSVNDSVAPIDGTASLPVNAQGQVLVAKVNGTDITLTVFERALMRFQQQQFSSMDASSARQMVLNTLIDQTLIEQAAAEQNVVVSEAELQAEIDESIALAGSQQAWEQWLASNLYTESEFRATLQDALIASRMRDLITQDLSGPIPQVHARHILVATEAEANGILERLNAGEDFGSLAQAYSRDVTTRQQGGDLGWFAQDALLEPYLAEVAFSMEPGTISGPVPTSLGFHIIQVLERAEQPIAETDRANLAQNRFENWLADLRSRATIERYL